MGPAKYSAVTSLQDGEFVTQFRRIFQGGCSDATLSLYLTDLAPGSLFFQELINHSRLNGPNGQALGGSQTSPAYL
jgi:hypothetical protein